MAENNTSKNGIVAREYVEKRESQLWWLAVVIIIMLAVALSVVDWTGAADAWWISPGLEVVLNTTWMRMTLITAILVICAYFRRSTRDLRLRNSELVNDLSQYGEQLEAKNCQTERLKALSEKLIGESDISNALDLIVDAAVEIGKADTASIMLRVPGQDILRIAASRGIPREIVESASIRIGEGLAGMVVKNGKAVVLNSDKLSGEAAKRARKLDSIASSAIVPIPVGDEIRGVMSVAVWRGHPCFAEEDLGPLSTLTNQASMVIQKIDLLEELRSKIDTLATTVGELRQTQEGLIQSEKLANIGQLAGGVAHEINNPLQVVLGRTELLIARNRDEQSSRELGAILDHTKRIADTVSNLLSFSRQSATAEFRDLDIGVVVVKTLDLLEPQMTPDDIVVVRDLLDGIPAVHGSACQLQQVFTNLILNAYHAMRSQGGGTLRVETRAEADQVVVSFVDSGPGIAPEHTAHIFEPFFTTKPEGEGTGLGLSIVYGIVQSHGGCMDVVSSPSGTCFRVVLPARVFG